MRLSFVRERFGAAGVDRYLSAGTPLLRAFFASPVRDDGWVDFGVFMEANTLLDQLFGKGDLELVRAAGHYAAQHNSGAWGALFARGINPEKFIEISAGLWHKHCDAGALVQTVVSPGLVKVEIRNMPAPHRAHCVSYHGWLEGVFALNPGVRVRVTERSCRASGDVTCELQLHWGA
jgi:hypothetical protein